MSCDGSSLHESRLTAPLREADDSVSAKKRKADVEKWAAMLAAGVVQVQTCETLGPSTGTPPEAWRGDVEPLTPRGVAASSAVQANAAGEANPVATNTDAEQTRLQVRVNIGELGELALVVERSAAGVNIQISAQDSSILEAMSAERQTLADALAGIGQSVNSLAFVTMDRVGINLAQPKLSSTQHARLQKNDKHHGYDAPQTKRRSRRINMIG